MSFPSITTLVQSLSSAKTQGWVGWNSLHEDQRAGMRGSRELESQKQTASKILQFDMFIFVMLCVYLLSSCTLSLLLLLLLLSLPLEQGSSLPSHEADAGREGRQRQDNTP